MPFPNSFISLALTYIFNSLRVKNFGGLQLHFVACGYLTAPATFDE